MSEEIMNPELNTAGTETAGTEPQAVETAPAAQAPTEPAHTEAQASEASMEDLIRSKLDSMEKEGGKAAESEEPDYVSSNLDDAKDAAKAKAPEAGAEPKQGEQKPAQEPAAQGAPKDPEQEEKELLAMAQNERSKARLQQVFKERKEGMQAKQSLSTLMKAFTDAGYDQESMQTMLILGHKMSSNDPAQIEEAIQALDRIRSNLCQQIGKEPALYDPLSEHPDLKKQVDDYSLTREQALQLAAARAMQAEQKAQQEAALQAQAQQAQMAERVNAGKVAIGNFFFSKRGELDYPAKMRALQAHLTPERVKNFVEKVPPEMWAQQIEFLYNNIGSQGRQATQRPISARQASLGRAAGSSSGSLQDDIVAKMNSMGI